MKQIEAVTYQQVLLARIFRFVGLYVAKVYSCVTLIRLCIICFSLLPRLFSFSFGRAAIWLVELFEQIWDRLSFAASFRFRWIWIAWILQFRFAARFAFEGKSSSLPRSEETQYPRNHAWIIRWIYLFAKKCEAKWNWPVFLELGTIEFGRTLSGFFEVVLCAILLKTLSIFGALLLNPWL